MNKTLFDELNEFAAEEQAATRIFKECEICGTSFEAKRKIRRYCDECQKNTELARYRMDAAIRRSKGPAVQKVISTLKTCEYCKREFESTNGRTFCSQKCKQNHKIENNKCKHL